MNEQEQDIAADVAESLRAVDNDFDDELELTLSIGGDPDNDNVLIGQVFYADSREAEITITVTVTNVRQVAA